ncbi:putative Cystatin domain-containing protein [Helianthus annuus]|nr:putative Cystatin domain-containing protein [Helianthus annuus]
MPISFSHNFATHIMGSSYHILLFTIFISLSVSFLFDISFASRGKTLDDGWTPIKDPRDPKVVSVGNFAVTTHNSQATSSLVFDSVVHGETKSDGGTNYNLTIAAKDGDDTLRNYVTLVIDRPYQNSFVLVSFKGPV